MWFTFVKIIASVLCLHKFLKIYSTFISIWRLLRKILSFISVVVCSEEFNLALGVVWITVLLWLISGLKWHEIFRVDCSLYYLFEVILLHLNAGCFLSYSILSEPCFKCYVSYTKTYFVKLIKLSCDVIHVVLCSHRC